MKKILQIGKYYPPFHGGMETVLRDLCTGLSKDSEYQTTVLCANHDNMSNFHDNSITPVIIRLKTIATILSQPIMPTFVAVLRKLIEKHDLVHLHSPNPFAEFFLYFCIGKKPFVITHHSDVVRQKFIAPIHSFFAKALYKKASAIIVPTKNHIHTSRILRNLDNNIEIIPFGLNTEEMITSDAIEDSANQKALSKTPYFLFVGRLVGYKGLEILVEAMRNVSSPAKVLIIGRGEDHDKIQALITQYNLQDRVLMLGRVDSMHEFAAYYKNCRALVLPSVSSNENFGMVQLEAMFYQRPIITTNLDSGVPVVAEAGVSSLLVEPSNAQQLANAMNDLLEHPEKAETMGQEARKLYDKKYQLHQFVDGHKKLYQRLIGKS